MSADQRTWLEIWRVWPKRTFCIIVQELCERYSYYGISTVLMIYFLSVLGLDDHDATILKQAFSMCCFITPMVGSVLADAYIGKFRTILYLSLVYMVGQATLTAAALHGEGLHPWADTLALMVVGLGAGGIKPCVSTFGGEQFAAATDFRLLSLFFSFFYFAVNVGATVSMGLSPVLRNMACLGKDSCFPMAFGVPTVFMVIATTIFVSASASYTKLPPAKTVFCRIFRTVKDAALNWRIAKAKRNHFLEHSLDTHNCADHADCDNGCSQAALIEDVRSLLRLLVMFIPVTVYAVLVAVRQPKWTLQALSMDFNVGAHFQILPDQTDVAYPVLILVLIPLQQGWLYPFVAKFTKVTPLRKMVVGAFITGFSMWMAAYVEYQIEASATPTPASSEAYVAFQSTAAECSVHVNGSAGVYNGLPWKANVDATMNAAFMHVKPGQVDVQIGFNGSNCPWNGFTSFLVLSPFKSNLVLCRTTAPNLTADCKPNSPADFYRFEPTANVAENASSDVTLFDYKSVRQGVWQLYIEFSTDTFHSTNVFLDEHRTSGVFLTVLKLDPQSTFSAANLNFVKPNVISILWIFPQVAIAVLAESFFQVTGYEFAFTQAAPSMRSVVQAVWLSTSALGDLIAMLVERSGLFARLWLEFAAYGLCMQAGALLLAYLAHFHYVYRAESATRPAPVVGAAKEEQKA